MDCTCGYSIHEEWKYCPECGCRLFKLVTNPLLELNWCAMPDTFTIKELARFLGLSDYSARTLTWQKKLPTIKNSSPTQIRKDKLLEWFKATDWQPYRKPTPPPPPAETVKEINWEKQPALLTTREVAILFKTNVSMIYSLIHQRKIPCYRIAGRTRFKTEEIIEWAKAWKMPLTSA